MNHRSLTFADAVDQLVERRVVVWQGDGWNNHHTRKQINRLLGIDICKFIATG